MALVSTLSDGLSHADEQVTLNDVELSAELLVRASALGAPLDAVLTTGLARFRLLRAAGHLEAADALVERVLLDGGHPSPNASAWCGETEYAMAAIERIAHSLDDRADLEAILAHALCATASRTPSPASSRARSN
ncbi:hypothetical protein [Streptomyces sp. AN091965]|uniref:hypothetical protein n=1 Tax=Streptomyces sp. AN091965 TaxID=2927803 RepID=UPI001F6043E7|nr:hypothetical protein [Streptomyces sp. AN091965]MCI3928064.1 hypothetical protein [Streptomyces sp. AN091965]